MLALKSLLVSRRLDVGKLRKCVVCVMPTNDDGGNRDGSKDWEFLESLVVFKAHEILLAIL